MAGNRIAKINAFLKTELSQLLEKYIQDEKTGLLTVTRIDTAADLSESRVWVSMLAGQLSELTCLKKLKQKSKLLQHEIRQKMSAHRIPRLKFLIDKNAEYVENIEKILQEIHNQ